LYNIITSAAEDEESEEDENYAEEHVPAIEQGNFIELINKT